MRIFWIKVITILVTGVLLFMYQTWALSYARMNRAVESIKTELEEQEQQQSVVYKDGIYEGTGKGYSGDLKVKVTVSGSRITEIEITETSDDQAYLGLAAQLTEDIIENQGVDGVDTVSGATFSSKGILEAVDSALKGASD